MAGFDRELELLDRAARLQQLQRGGPVLAVL